MKKKLLFFLFFTLLLFAVYRQAIQFDFTHLDDYEQLVNKSEIKSVNYTNLKSIFQSTTVGMYQPLSSTIYMIIYAAFGLNPEAYHLTALLFHLFNGFLLFLFLKHFKIEQTLRFLLFAIFLFHPMQVESVAWVSAFSNLVFSCFFLSGILSYLAFKKKRKKSFYFLSLLLFLMACFSKATAVVFPMVLLLIDYYDEQKFRFKFLWNKLPFFTFSILFGIITVYSREAAGHLSDLSLSFSLVDRFFLIGYSVLFYPLKFLLPVNLSVFYPYPEITDGMLPVQYYLSAPIILLMLFFGWKNRHKKQLIFGLAFYLICIAPVIQLIPLGNQLTTDRYIYLPMIGLLLLVASVIRKLGISSKIVYLFFSIPLLLAFLSNQRVQIWESDQKIWSDVLKKYPKVAQAHNNLGSALLEEGNIQQALFHFNQAISLKSYYADAYVNKGNVLAQVGQSEQAIEQFNKAIQLRPHANAYFNRANEWSKKGEFKIAIEDYKQSIALKAGPDAYTNLAYAYVQLREMKKARKNLTEAIRLNPNYDQAYFIEGMSYHLENKIELACRSFQIAIKKGNKNAEAAYKKLCL